MAEEKSQEICVIYGNRAFEMTQMLLQKRDWFQGLHKSSEIAIKPNLVLAKPSSSGATTDPEIVRAIVGHLQERGFENLSVIESAWLGDDTKRAFKTCGYEKIAAEFGIPLFDLKDDETVSRSGLQICKKAIAADLLVNVPVLKAHCQTRLTCALKNMKGVIPDKEKRRYHQLGIHGPVAALNKELGRQLIIVDGIVGDLTFEEGGTPVQMNRVIMCEDPVLIDAYAASLLGYQTEDIAYIPMAEELGVGQSSLATVTELNSPKENRLVDKEVMLGQKRIESLVKDVQAKEACSACYGSLVHALQRLSDKGALPQSFGPIVIGQLFRDLELPKGAIGVGACTAKCANYIAGCPPRTDEIVRFLLQYGKE